MHQHEFLYYKLIYLLTINRQLKWKVNEKGLSAQLTDELSVNLRFYDNGEKPSVIDFELIYGFHDFNINRQSQNLLLRFKEKDEKQHIFQISKLYYFAEEQSRNETFSTEKINPIEILNEYQSVYELKKLNENAELSPFDDKLFEKVIKLALY